MWKTGEFRGPPGSSADDPSTASAGASFSAGPAVGSDNYVGMRAPARAGRVSGGLGPGLMGRQCGRMTVHEGAWRCRQCRSGSGASRRNDDRSARVRRADDHARRTDDRDPRRRRRSRCTACRIPPSHVEVLEDDGRRKVVPVPDVERVLVHAITIVGAVASIYGLRYSRRTGAGRNTTRRSRP